MPICTAKKMPGFTLLAPVIYAMRLAESNNRVTKNELYKLYIEDSAGYADYRRIKIFDNNGNEMEPKLSLLKDSTYWAVGRKIGHTFVPFDANYQKKIKDASFMGKTRFWQKEATNVSMDAKEIENRVAKTYTGSTGTYNFNQPEDKKMKLEITNPTLINGEDVAKMDDGQLIHFIKEVETAIEKLEKVKTPSKRIDKIIKEHQANATKLVKILDARK